MGIERLCPAWACARNEDTSICGFATTMTDQPAADSHQRKDELCSACSLPPRLGTNGERIPLKICTRCQGARYHDAACQRLHYPKHKRLCRKAGEDCRNTTITTSSVAQMVASARYRIEDRPSRGRCMLSKNTTATHQSLAANPEWAPVAAPVLFESHRSSRCAICFANDVEHVVLCHDKRYAVRVCQTCVNTDHGEPLRREVDAVQAAAQIPRVLSTAILIYRICVKILSKEVSFEESIGCMISHSLGEGDDPDADVHQQAVVMTVSALLGLSEHSMDPYRIVSILSRIKVNAFTITDSNGESLGIGLFRMAHFINHSCRPNTRQSFLVGVPGCLPELELTAISTIQKNEEITISYLDTGGLSSKQRRAQLSESYHFLCQCPACTKTDE